MKFIVIRIAFQFNSSCSNMSYNILRGWYGLSVAYNKTSSFSLSKDQVKASSTKWQIVLKQIYFSWTPKKFVFWLDPLLYSSNVPNLTTSLAVKVCPVQKYHSRITWKKNFFTESINLIPNCLGNTDAFDRYEKSS